MPRGKKRIAKKRIVKKRSKPLREAGIRPLGNADPNELVEVTLHLRSRNRGKKYLDKELAGIISGKGSYLSREDWADKYGADPKEMARVEKFARENGLTVGRRHAGARMLHVTAQSNVIEKFFGVKRQVFEHKNGSFTGHLGKVRLPATIAGMVEYVSGLDARPQGNAHPRPQWIFVPSPQLTPSGFLPTEVAKVYGFPTSFDGTGQTIGVIELGGGIREDDLKSYCAWMKTAEPTLVCVPVHGKGNDPDGKTAQYDGEVSGDIETIAGIAPGARIVAYFTGNSNEAFLDAVKYAIHDQENKPSVLSVSWGDPESEWSPSTMQMFNQVLQEAATLGVTVCCASGDYGSSAGVKEGGLHVCFPASSPYALACGGTSLRVSNITKKIASETVWNNSDGASGGGFSDVFPMPDWQQSTDVAQQAKRAGVSGRGVPDVASVGDPKTGFIITVNGKHPVGAGTSAAAPVWAGLIALINQKLGSAAGFINPFLYGNYADVQEKGWMRAITEGNNGAYHAGPGWNPCTGFGSPNGERLMDALVDQLSAAAGASKSQS